MAWVMQFLSNKFSGYGIPFRIDSGQLPRVVRTVHSEYRTSEEHTST